MNKLFVTLAFCASVSVGTSLASSVDILDWQCQAGQNIGPICYKAGEVLVVFSTEWSDNNPKVVVATINGQPTTTNYFIDSPGLDTMSVTYVPMVPNASYEFASVVLDLFTIENGQYVWCAGTNTNGSETWAQVYNTPVIFDFEEAPTAIVGQVCCQVHALDWNIASTVYNDCGQKRSFVEARLINCATLEVLESQQQEQYWNTSDHYSFSFIYDGLPTDLKIELRLLHSENGLADIGFGTSFSAVIVTTESDCFLAGDMSTSTEEVVTNSFQSYPNPFFDKCRVTTVSKSAVVTDMNGRVVWTGQTDNSGAIDGTSFIPGNYVVRFQDGTARTITKR